MALTKSQSASAAIRLQILKYFPVDDEQGHVKQELARLFERMVETPEQLEWLVSTLIDQVGTYPGTEQIRAVYCTRYKPLDGIEANLSPEMPLYRTAEECEATEKHRAFIEPSTRREIAGEVSRKPEPDLTAQLASLGINPEAKKMPDAPTGTGPITEDDVRRAKAEYLRSKFELLK